MWLRWQNQKSRFAQPDSVIKTGLVAVSVNGCLAKGEIAYGSGVTSLK